MIRQSEYIGVRASKRRVGITMKNLLHEYLSEIVGGLVVALISYGVTAMRDVLGSVRVVILIGEVISVAVSIYVLTVKQKGVVYPHEPHPRFSTKAQRGAKIFLVSITAVAVLSWLSPMAKHKDVVESLDHNISTIQSSPEPSVNIVKGLDTLGLPKPFHEKDDKFLLVVNTEEQMAIKLEGKLVSTKYFSDSLPKGKYEIIVENDSLIYKKIIFLSKTEYLNIRFQDMKKRAFTERR